MSSKISVTAAIVGHLDTLKDARTGKYRIRDFLALYGTPVAGAAVVARVPVELKGVGNIIAGVSILTALLFGLIIYVFQLRLQVATDPRVARGGSLVTLLDELFSNLIYAVIFGLLTTVVSVAASSSANDYDTVNRWWSMVVVAFAGHLILVILMCLKRTRDAYEQLTI